MYVFLRNVIAVQLEQLVVGASECSTNNHSICSDSVFEPRLAHIVDLRWLAIHTNLKMFMIRVPDDKSSSPHTDDCAESSRANH